MTTTHQHADAARTLAIAARERDLHGYSLLYLPDHEDLSVTCSTDPYWFHLQTPTGSPAVWNAIWYQQIPAGDDEEPDEIKNVDCGTFANLNRRLTEILTDPLRVPAAPVDLHICEWALFYQLPCLYPAPDCVRRHCMRCRRPIDPDSSWKDPVTGPCHYACPDMEEAQAC